MTLPTIPESVYAAAWRRWLQSGEDDCRPLLAECLDAVWPDLYALAVASLPAPEPPAVVLPTVDEVEKAWRAAIARGERVRDASQAVLDLIGSRVPVWVPVKAGAVIKAGTRYRCEAADGGSAEGTYSLDLTTREGGWFIDPRTVPVDPDADLVEAMARASWAAGNPPGDDWDDLRDPERGDYLDDSRVQLAAIRETHTIEPKPTTGPLGGAR